MNIFVTGTDTDVGKTIVSSWICLHTKAAYWKPVQTGFDSDKSFVSNISGVECIEEVYKLKNPLSPYDASRIEGVKIEKSKFFDKIPNKSVIEGAGGVLVPIAHDFLMTDLIKHTNSKVLIVAKSRLGFLNHIFMTVEALRSRDIQILGIIINGETDKKDTIEMFSKEKVLKILPFSESIEKELINIELPKEIKEVLL